MVVTFLGTLLVDEMKLTKTLHFNKQNLKLEGFNNLGKHTPDNQKGKAGALFLMFQPFRGKWVQTLGCFLSRGSASGKMLRKLLMECIILWETAGLWVNAITMDGATWNRSMWRIFGLNETAVSVPHIVDGKRRLWFISDFPHLIKCVCNFFIKHGQREGIWVNEQNVEEQKKQILLRTWMNYVISIISLSDTRRNYYAKVLVRFIGHRGPTELQY